MSNQETTRFFTRLFPFRSSLTSLDLRPAGGSLLLLHAAAAAAAAPVPATGCGYSQLLESLRFVRGSARPSGEALLWGRCVSVCTWGKRLPR